MKTRLYTDTVILLIIALLLTTIIAFVTGILHYPVGILLLILLGVARILYLRNHK